MRSDNMQPASSEMGFSRLEFAALIASGILIVALLAHFIFDQSIQVERLRALVSRDVVRLNLETRLLNGEILRKSVESLKTPETLALRACVLGDKGNADCPDKATCCLRGTNAVPILELGDERRIIAGTEDSPMCLDEKGEPTAATSGDSCFAKAFVVLEPVCANGAIACRQAIAVLIHYRIDFMPGILKSESGMSRLERTISLVVAETRSGN